MNWTLLTCCHNTPGLVPNLLRSLVRAGKSRPRVLVVDTSTEPDCARELEACGIRFLASPETCHGEAVNVGLARVETPFVLLVDSDVLFLRDPNPLVEEFVRGNFTLMGEVVGDVGGKLLFPRIVPWFCLLHRDRLASHGIRFFDGEKTRQSRGAGGRVYDIGSTMLEAVRKRELTICEAASLENRYYRHYGGMSWRVQKFNPRDSDTDVDFGGTHPRRDYYDWGLRVRAEYDRDVRRLARVEISGLFP